MKTFNKYLSQSDTYYENETRQPHGGEVMDKISSIISTSRKHVDMSKERPVRAGAPSYGQPISEATHTFGVEKEAKNAQVAQTEQAKLFSPDVFRHTGMIDKITLSFKGNSERPEQKETFDIEPEPLPTQQLESTASETEVPSVDIYA